MVIHVFGASINAEPACLDDMELLDLMVDSDRGNAIATSQIVSKILSKEDKTALYNAIREEDGRVPIAKVGEAILTIIRQLGDSASKKDGKN